MYVAKHPKIGHLVAPKGEERGAGPLHKLASRRISENFPEMNAMESHASECLLVLHNQIEDVAAVIAECVMHEIYIRGKSLMAGSGLA